MLLTSLSAVGLADLLDIALVAVLIYALLVWFKRARAAVVAKGMLVVTAVYMLSRGTGMIMTTSIFHGFFAILLVALVVIFQEELRSIFERIAVWSLAGGKSPFVAPTVVDTLVRTLGDLARDHIGALLVLGGKDPLERHLEGGFPLNGELSEALIKSIFDESSIGHDGAVVIAGGKVARFGARLPLSKDLNRTAKLGTRHTAALGLAELTDAMCIVVSEERGTISIAYDGKLEIVRKLADLQEKMKRFAADKIPQPPRETVRAFVRKNQREKTIAVAASFLLWVLFVLGAKGWRQAFDVPIRAENVPAELQIAVMKPEKVRVTFSGIMREFYWVDRRRLAVRLDLSQARRGRNRIRVADSDVSRPAGFFLEDISPTIVEIGFKTKEKDQKVSLWR